MDAMDQAKTTEAQTVEDHTTVAAEKTPGSALLERLPSARKAVACDVDTHTFIDIDNLEELRHAASDDTVHIWLDFSRPSAEEMAHLAERLHLHPLAVEDALTGHQRPKIEEYDGFFFLVFYALMQQDAATNGNAAATDGALIDGDGTVKTQ